METVQSPVSKAFHPGQPQNRFSSPDHARGGSDDFLPAHPNVGNLAASFLPHSYRLRVWNIVGLSDCSPKGKSWCYSQQLKLS